MASGAFDESGTFVAKQVLAKHDERYMPREVSKALKEQGEWRGDGASLISGALRQATFQGLWAEGPSFMITEFGAYALVLALVLSALQLILSAIGGARRSCAAGRAPGAGRRSAPSSARP